jgi:hypothetical protein
MNEITVTLSFSNTHTIYKKKKANFQESYVIKQLLHLNLINMRFYVAEYNNIASFNIVVLCSIKPHIDLVQVQ